MSGLLIVVPIYLATLLLLKGMASVVGVVRPVALLLPDWIPGEMALALKTISRWGSGARDLVAAMEKGQKAAL